VVHVRRAAGGDDAEEQSASGAHARESVHRASLGLVTPPSSFARRALDDHDRSVKIGPYEVVRPLGKGGVGAVFQARSPAGEEVAVKVLLRLDEQRLARFERERRLLGAFTARDGFVPLIDAGVTPEGPYIVMPIVPGGTLRDRLAKGALGIDETVALGRTLARAVARAHARGIVHRDLKPENVLFTAEGQPLVADLGLAKHFDFHAPGASRSVSLSARGTTRGTFGYMPIEQMRDAPSVGPAADVFALGAVLHECLAGKPAFDGETFAQILEHVASGKTAPLARERPEAPRWLVAVIERALAPAAADRFRDGAALLAALAPRPAGSMRARAWSLAALGLVAAVGVPGALLFRHGNASGGGNAEPPAGARAVPQPTGDEVARLRIAASSGDAAAMVELGRRYTEGDGVRADAVEAVAWYRRAAGAGHLDGMLWFGISLVRGSGVPRDEKAGAGWVLRAAEAGDLHAMNELGLLYVMGVAVEPSDREAARWFRKSALGGYANAMGNLGQMFLDGRGVAKDEAEAVRWFRRGAEAGVAGAMTSLALCLREGCGVAKDAVEARLWASRGAAKNDAKAMRLLALMLRDGEGGTRDPREAVRWLRKSAELGDGDSMVLLAAFLRDGPSELRDDVEAVRWLRRAAEAGVDEAMAGLAYSLRDGQGVPRDAAESVRWFREAALRGNGGAMAGLGVALKKGDGTPRDEVEAVRWFRLGADKGDLLAIANLASCFYEGRGVAKDVAEAVRLFRQAAEGGAPFGMRNYGLLLYRGEGRLAKNEAEGVSWIRKAAELGDEDSRKLIENLGAGR
jgi:TPR repeat protein